MAAHTSTHPQCPLHEVTMTLRSGKFGRFYGCPFYPDCDYTASRPDNRYPWMVTNQEHRNWKHQAHAALDALWDGETATMRRGESYRWLQKQMGLDSFSCHIQLFTVEQCKRVIELCESLGIGGKP